MSSDRVPAGQAESSSADWVQAATFAIQDSPHTGLPSALIRKIDLQHLWDAPDAMSEIPICPPGSGQWLPEGPYAAVLFGPGKQVFCYRFGRRLAGVDGVLFALDKSDVSADPMLLEDRLMSVLVALEQAFEMEGELSIRQGTTGQAEPFHREMESFRIHALYEISTRSGLSVDGRIREMLHLCSQMMGLEKGRVLEFDHPNRALRTLVSTETNGPAPNEPIQGTFAEAVLHAGTVLTTDSAHYIDISGSQFAVGAPFKVHGSVQGCIVLSTSRSRTSDLETEDRSFLELVARWFGSQSENRRVESFIDSFFNVAGDLLCILDETGQAIKLNQAWEKNTGFTEQEILSRPMADFLADGEGSAFDDALEEALNFGIARGLDNRFIVRGGAVR
ncbi:MAG: PAS domain S-box protein, partial [Leptospiraceae bacterium]|nr:PAS domain S-box protein [Leptospiraceae bacterium]